MTERRTLPRNHSQAVPAEWCIDPDEEELDYAITTGLAQRLVEHVSARLGSDINLMNRDGRIIGSTDRTRIGSLHPGAFEAVTTNETVVTAEGSCAPGTRAGINLPLAVDGRVIGAVGVTGDPDAVDRVGSIVALTVELLLREEQSGKRARWRDVATRDVMGNLVGGTLRHDELITALRYIGVPASPPWTLTAIVRSERRSQGFRDDSLLRRVQEIPTAAAVVMDRTIWTLLGSTDSWRALRDLATAHSQATTTIFGRPTESISDLTIDAQRLHHALEHPGNLPEQDALDLTTLDIEIALAQQAHEISRELARRLVAPLSVPLQDTARAFLNSNLSVRTAASRLHIHRNTLIQRLDRIASLTGLNIRRFDDGLRMRLALLAANTSHGSVRGYTDSAFEPPGHGFDPTKYG